MTTIDEYMRKKTKRFDGASGSIQWKNTDVRMDISCSCGHVSHVDAEFFYYYRCGGCGAIYGVSTEIQLVKIPQKLLAEVSHYTIESGH